MKKTLFITSLVLLTLLLGCVEQAEQIPQDEDPNLPEELDPAEDPNIPPGIEGAPPDSSIPSEDPDTPIDSTPTGNVVSNIRESSDAGVANKGICSNAQVNGLCSGLDITFGVGYKEECCNNHALCC